MRRTLLSSHGWIALAWACGILGIAGCGAGPSGTDAHGHATPASQQRAITVYKGEYPYRLVTTCGMVTDIVTQVAGSHAKVHGIMGEGVDPHLFKPTRDHIKDLMHADVIVYSGLMLEGRMGDTFAKIGRSGKPVFAVTEGIDESYLREPPEMEGHVDPHVWMDVSAWSACVEFAAKALSEFDPKHADDYKKNAEAYRAELKELDAYVRKSIATIPEQQRVLVTAHDAFGYFSRAYKIPVLSAQGVSTESEAGVHDVNKLVDELVTRKVPAVFFESSVSPKNIQAVIEGAGRKGHTVRIGGELFSDAMGKGGTYEGTYIGMLDHNATTITRALGGDAPAKGMQGKLIEPE